MRGKFSKASFIFLWVSLADFKAFLVGIYWSTRISILSVTFSFFKMLIQDHLGDTNITYLFITYFFFQKVYVEWNEMVVFNT